MEKEVQSATIPPEVSKHCGVVLHQCKESTVIKGGRVGGDAWIGLVKMCVELKKRCNAYSTFIIKQNVNNFQMQLLHKVHRARHGCKAAEHWVVTQETIADVEVFSLQWHLCSCKKGWCPARAYLPFWCK